MKNKNILFPFSEAIETLQSANNVFSRVGVSNESVDTAAKLPTRILSSLFPGKKAYYRPYSKRKLEMQSNLNEILPVNC